MTRNADTQSEKQTPALGPEQVLKMLNQYLKMSVGEQQSGDTPNLVAQAAALIRQQAAQLAEAQAGSWISVAERLPEPFQPVLLYAHKSIYLGHWADGKKYWGKGEEKPRWVCFAHDLGAKEPTHWQPLPAPPAQEAQP